MIYLQETTKDWKVDYHVPSHIYIVDDKKEFVHGYIPEGSNVTHMFAKKMPFSTSRRKFKIVTQEWANKDHRERVYPVHDFEVIVP